MDVQVKVKSMWGLSIGKIRKSIGNIVSAQRSLGLRRLRKVMRAMEFYQTLARSPSTNSGSLENTEKSTGTA